jgi:hypothetical protein
MILSQRTVSCLCKYPEDQTSHKDGMFWSSHMVKILDL